MKRNFLSLSDLGDGGLSKIIETSAQHERNPSSRAGQPGLAVENGGLGPSGWSRRASAPGAAWPLAGKSVALLFEKPSTRTRVSLELAVHALGGHPVVLDTDALQMSRGESLADTARSLSGYVDAIALRTGRRARLRWLADAATVPVINALTDASHPLQLLADLYVVHRRFGRLAGLKFTWVGDGTNVCRSWVEAAGLLGLDLVVASPPGFGPPPEELRRAGEKVRVVVDPTEAATNADVVITDVWTSMGTEHEVDDRRAALRGYRVDHELLSVASKEAAVLHCLPAHRGEEIEAAVLDGPQSLAWQASAARLPTTCALLAWVMGDPPTPVREAE